MTKTAAMHVYRLTENGGGESSFDDSEIIRTLTTFAPPAVPFYTSAIEKAAGYTAIRIPVGWIGELHRSPYRQMLFCWAGALKVTATDGSVRTVKAGDAWLMADNHGKGHRSEVVSDVPFDAVIIILEK
ncbi:MAG: cupin domain-containing protein [Hyphomicrobiales bacterium]